MCFVKTIFNFHFIHLITHSSNEHLTETVSNEIEQLKDFIQNNTKGRLTGNATLEEELYDAQVLQT